jgi:16S rRNA processing protein RimM
MNREDCVELGHLAKPHGLDGQLKAVFDVHDINEYANLRLLYLAPQDEALRPVAVEEIELLSTNTALIRLPGVGDRASAEAYAGQAMFFPINLLPQLPEDQFYFHEIVGFEVEELEKGKLGKLEQVLDLPNNALMQLTYQGKEVLIPMQDDILLEVDKQAKIIRVALPEGLLELYTGEA